MHANTTYQRPRRTRTNVSFRLDPIGERWIMRIGSSIALIAIGAILSFAVRRDTLEAVDLTIVGYILMGVGALGLVITLIAWAAGRNRPPLA